MICHNSVGYDAQIKDLLIKSAFNMDTHNTCSVSGKTIKSLLVFKSQKER